MLALVYDLAQIEALQHEDMSKVAAGEYHCMALTHDGARLYAWGRCDTGELGLGKKIATDNVNVPTPTIVTFYERTTRCLLKDIQCGARHSMALSYEGDVYTWGNTNGSEVVMATGFKVKEGEDVYVPTKLPMKVDNLNMEAIAMTGGTYLSMFLVQERAEDDAGEE